MKHPFLSEIKEDARWFFRMLPPVFKSNRWSILLFILFIGIVAVWLHPLDVPFNRTMVESQTESLAKIGDAFRWWGDFRDTVTVTALLLIGGAVFKRRSWRRIAVAFFLSVCLAGLVVNVLRFTTGRPRPHLQYQQLAEDRFYGPVFLQSRSERPGQASFKSFQSFPSGHSGTSVAAATMLLIAAPALGVPMLFSASGIVWASVYGSSHYITDVTVGSAIGILFGVLGGLACRRMQKK